MFQLGNFDWKPDLINPNTGKPRIALVFCWSSTKLNNWADAVQFYDGIVFRNFGENRSPLEVVRGFETLKLALILSDIPTPIILTTNRIELMSNHVSRPDCIFVLQRGESNPKPIWTITEKEIRREHNLQKMWIGGMFD